MTDMASNKIRAFVAACLPPELLKRIEREQKRLESRLAPDSVRWTREEQLHLTLKFFGNVDRSDLEALQQALSRAVAGLRPFRLAVVGLGCFPSSRRPNVIWLGLEGEVTSLEQLQAQVESQSAAFGSHSETRAFHPHLTIGRVKVPGANQRALGDLIEHERVAELGSWQVTEIVLMQSQLSPHGSTYTALGQFRL